MPAIIPVKDLTTEDILYGDRTTQYRWEVLEHANGVDYLVGTLDGVSDGSLSWVQNAAVKGRGKMEVIDLDQAQPGMLRIADVALESCRIRPVMTINGADERGTYSTVWTESRRNLVLNPAFKVDSSGWSGAVGSGGAASLVRADDAPGCPAPYRVRVTVTTKGSWFRARSQGTGISVTEGETYTLSGYMRGTPASDVRLIIIWLNSSGSTIVENGGSSSLYLSSSTFNRYHYTAVAPAGAVAARVDLGRLQGEVGDWFDVSSVMLEQGSSPSDFFYGDTISPVPYRRYAWLGTANDSASVEQIRSQEWAGSGEPVIPEIPWGTFLLEKASEEWKDTGRVWKLSLLDRTTVPSQDVVDQSYSVAAGTNILRQVRTILSTCGEYIAINDSVTITTRSGMAWEAGTSKLKIINDLLDSAGYNSLWMDGTGDLQATPRVLPAERSILYEVLAGVPRELVDGSSGIYSPSWKRERDSFGVPNKVIAVQAAGGDDSTALVGQWTNTDPDSPYSYPSRGRWVPHVLDSVDCPEGTNAQIQAFLNERARATLIQMSSVQAEVKVTHLPIPVRVGDVLRFANTRAGIDARHVITRLDLDTSPTGLMKSTLQEVISL